MTRCMARAGLRVASLDVEKGQAKPGKQNPWDILTPSGMACFSCVSNVFEFYPSGFYAPIRLHILMISTSCLAGAGS